MKAIMISSVLSALLLVSCSSSTKEAVEIKADTSSATAAKAAVAKDTNKTPSKDAVKQEPTKKMPHDAIHNAFKNSKMAQTSPELSKFYTIFSDGAKIAPKDGKSVLLVFGQPADPYTQKLQNDVVSNKELAKAITESTTPIYINAAANKLHKFLHNGDMMDVDTKTLVSIYHLDATPTLIFMDDKLQSIFIVPGYMPPKQFEVTLQFVREGVWRGKDRKNGEVYKALKEYYISHGVKVGEPKK